MPSTPPSTAFESWSLTTPQTRSLALLKIADILDENADELGRLESSQTGKPVGAAIDEMATSSDLFRFFAGACRVMEGLAVTEYLEGHTSMVRRDPVGVVASIAPWNYPLYMAAWKLGPALATGNTVVLKPSVRTPLSALRFAELVSDQLPEGVLNVLSGSGSAIGDLLVGHPKVRMVSITGDTVDRQAHRRDRRGHREAAAPRARRQGPGDRVRRRRCRAGGRDHQDRPATGTAARTAPRPAA